MRQWRLDQLIIDDSGSMAEYELHHAPSGDTQVRGVSSPWFR